MASSGDFTKDGSTEKDSRWHQCPRCSFWFDCLTEPSFANRPDEVTSVQIGEGGLFQGKPELMPLSADIDIGPVLMASDIKLETQMSMENNASEGADNLVGKNESLSNSDLFYGDLLDDPAISNLTDGTIANSKKAGTDEQKFIANFKPRKRGRPPNSERLNDALSRTIMNEGGQVKKRKIGRPKKPKMNLVKVKKTPKKIVIRPGQGRNRLKLASFCRDFTFDCTDRYFYMGNEVAREDLDNYYRFKECNLCGRIVVETKLHMFNSHVDGETKEVIFNLTDKRPKAPGINPNAPVPKAILDAKARAENTGKRVKTPRQCDICYEWFFDHLGDHMFLHKEELFPFSEKPVEKYFFGDQEIPVEDLHNYSKWKECCLCGHFVKYTSRHIDDEHFGKGGPEVRYNLSAKNDADSEESSDEEFDKVPKKKCKLCGKKVRRIFGHMKKEHEEIACKKCNSKFYSQDDIDKHKCPETIQVQCTICNEWLSKAELHQHLSKVHLDPKTYPCLECNTVFSSVRTLKCHAETHSGLTVACSKCDKVYPGPLHLANHEKKVHSTDGQRFYCDKCGKHYKQRESLRCHIRDEHGDQPKVTEMLECHICHKQYPGKQSFNQHVSKVHATSKDFQCEICAKAFVSKERMRYHLKYAHTDERPEHCDKCRKTFKTPDQLKNHKARVHSDNVISHFCAECGKGFKMERDMKKHVQVVHAPPCDPIPCEYPDCTTMFKDKRSLKAHLRDIHIETVCRECNMEFRFVQDYRVHMAQHAGKQIHSCPVCQKLYHLRYLLVNHIGRIHKDFDISLLPK